MKNTIHMLAIAALCAVTLMRCAHGTPGAHLDVYHLHIGFTEAYALKGTGDKFVLVDTGIPGSGDLLDAQLRQVGLKPEDVGAVIVTHGHGDHAGNARLLQTKYGATVIGGEGDLDKFTRGKTDLAKAQSIGEWGERFRPVSDLAYEPFTPDVVVKDGAELDLSKYGVEGTVKGLSGHTPGELIVIAGRNLFVGDELGGTFVLADPAQTNPPLLVPTGHAMEWVFAESPEKARARYAELAAMLPGVDTVYPAHFGPLSVEVVARFVERQSAR